MSESIAEMVLPGTYIEVRSEGLISVGSVATGNIGIVGTAGARARNQVVQQIERRRGDRPLRRPKTCPRRRLTRRRDRALARAHAAARVRGRRAATSSRSASPPVTSRWRRRSPCRSRPQRRRSRPFALTAVEGNAIAATTPGGQSSTTAQAPPRQRVSVTYRNRARESRGRERRRSLRTALGRRGELGSSPSVGARPDAAAIADSSPCRRQPDRRRLRLPAVEQLARRRRARRCSRTSRSTSSLVAGLGADVGGRRRRSRTSSATENDGRERIAVVGATLRTAVRHGAQRRGRDRDDRMSSSRRASTIADARQRHSRSRCRRRTGGASSPGRLSTLAPHISLTNQDAADHRPRRATTPATRATHAAAEPRAGACAGSFGFQVVQGHHDRRRARSSRSPSAASSTTPRPACGSGPNPYIGKLNNARVRAALKATLDGFLSQMVLDEMLIGYELDVTATRAQEIRASRRSSMTLQPTFSIDFIRVTMNLQ